MQHVIPFFIQTASPPNGTNGVLKISAGDVPWTRSRMQVVTEITAALVGWFGQPDLTLADMQKDYARFGSSGYDAAQPPTFDFLAGGFGSASGGAWFDCPAGGTQHITIYSPNGGHGVLIFEPLEDDDAK